MLKYSSPPPRREKNPCETPLPASFELFLECLDVETERLVRNPKRDKPKMAGCFVSFGVQEFLEAGVTFSDTGRNNCER